MDRASSLQDKVIKEVGYIVYNRVDPRDNRIYKYNSRQVEHVFNLEDNPKASKIVNKVTRREQRDLLAQVVIIIVIVTNLLVLASLESIIVLTKLISL